MVKPKQDIPGPKLIDYIGSKINKFSTVVVVGGYNGKWAKKFHEKYYSAKKRFYILEPEILSYTALCENMPGFKNRPFGISNTTKTDTLYVQTNPDAVESSQGNSMFKDFLAIKENQSLIKPQKCHFLTMWDFIGLEGIDDIRLCYFNAEGAEFLAFQDPSWLKCVDILWFYIHSKAPVFRKKSVIRQKVEILRELKKQGFDQLFGYNEEKIQKKAFHSCQIWIRHGLK